MTDVIQNTAVTWLIRMEVNRSIASFSKKYIEIKLTTFLVVPCCVRSFVRGERETKEIIKSKGIKLSNE